MPIAGSRMSASMKLGALERDARRAGVEAGDVLDVRVVLEPRGELRADVAADAGDEDPAPRH